MLENQRLLSLSVITVKHMKKLGMLKTNQGYPNQTTRILAKLRRGLHFL